MPHVPARAQRQHRRFPASVRVSLGAMVGMGLLLPSTLSATEVVRRGFDIPAGDAEVTLKQFAAQSGEQLLYSPDDVSGIRTHAVHGQFTPIRALEQMLKGTPLKARQDGKTQAIAITAIAPRAAPRFTATAADSISATASQAADSIAGRVENLATGRYLNNTRISVKGTELVVFIKYQLTRRFSVTFSATNIFNDILRNDRYGLNNPGYARRFRYGAFGTKFSLDIEGVF